MAAKSLRDLNQKYRGKPKKYAEGGRVQSSAAAPVLSPTAPGYLDRLMAQPVGAEELIRDSRDVTALDQVGRRIGEVYQDFMETPERIAQEVYDYAVERGVDPETAAMRADRIARRAGMTTTAVDFMVPRSAGDVALGAAGPIGRIAPAAGRAALVGAGAMMGMEPSEAKAGVIRRALNAARGVRSTEGYRPVMPQPERLMPQEERVAGGRYLENPVFDPVTRQGSGTDITEQIRAGARVQIGPDGKAVMLVAPETAEIPTARSAGPQIRTNLFRRSAGWNWVGEPPPGAQDFPTIVSVKHGNNHYYALGTDFEGPVRMARYPKERDEPKLRPTAKGDIELGQQVGRIIVRGKEEHPVYDMIYNIPRYAEGGLAELDQKYADAGKVRVPPSKYDADAVDRIVREFAEGGEVEAPAEATIGGQDHKLAYITDREASLLKARGGSGRMTRYGIRAYDDGNGDGNSGGDANDNSTSNSEASSQDAVGGNAGQGAGPTGAGAGSTGEAGPGNSEGLGEAGADTEDADQGKAMAAAPPGTYAGFSPISFSQALEAYDQGRMSLGQLAANMAISSVPGVTPGVNRDAIGEITEAISVSPVGLGLGLAGLATGVPGLGTLGSMAGTALGQAMGVGNVVGTPSTTNLGPDATGGADQYGNYGYGAYGTPNVDNSSTGGFAKGGLADLSAKYAGGGEVEDDEGVERYDPREIDALASEFVKESSPIDLTQRVRMLMRGQNVGMPESTPALAESDNDRATISASMRDMPIEDDRYGISQRAVNAQIGTLLDAERNARLGAGLTLLERSGDRGFTGYAPQLSASYGPASVYGGYQTITPNVGGAKPQGLYIYGGNLNIPLDDEGSAANIGGTVMSGRRGQGPSGLNTQIMGSLERPLLGGRLALELAADPSLRHKEILLGYRRAF